MANYYPPGKEPKNVGGPFRNFIPDDEADFEPMADESEQVSGPVNVAVIAPIPDEVPDSIIELAGEDDEIPTEPEPAPAPEPAEKSEKAKPSKSSKKKVTK